MILYARIWDSASPCFGVVLDLFEDTPCNANANDVFLLLLSIYCTVLCSHDGDPFDTNAQIPQVHTFSSLASPRLASPRFAMSQARGK